jgi:hypothetical protein
MIIIRKRRTTCIFCGQITKGKEYKGKAICNKCAEEFKITV